MRQRQRFRGAPLAISMSRPNILCKPHVSGLQRRRSTLTVSASATVPTAQGSKYLQQLCKHWQHNLSVEFTTSHGEVIFPKDVRGADWPADALITFDAGPAALTVRIDASRRPARQPEGGGRAPPRPFCLSRGPSCIQLALTHTLPKLGDEPLSQRARKSKRGGRPSGQPRYRRWQPSPFQESDIKMSRD